jgi:hypothetical protein
VNFATFKISRVVKRGVRIVVGFKPDTGKISKDSLLCQRTDGQRSPTSQPESARLRV